MRGSRSLGHAAERLHICFGSAFVRPLTHQGAAVLCRTAIANNCKHGPEKLSPLYTILTHEGSEHALLNVIQMTQEHRMAGWPPRQATAQGVPVCAG